MLKLGSIITRTLTAPLSLVVMVLCAPAIVQAENSAVTFVVVENSGIQKEIIRATEQTLSKAGIEIDKTIIETNNSAPAKTAVNIPHSEHPIVTLGTRAAAFAYQHYPDKPVVNALITRSSFAQVNRDNVGDSEEALNHRITPLLIDQPVSRFFALGLQLVADAKTIGILVGPSNKAKIPDIKAKAESLGLTTNIALLEPHSNPIKIIEPVMRSSDFFVVLPDRQHINQLAAKWILPLSYRYRTPLIAYSKKYVDAGALASVFTSADNIAATIAKQLQENTPKTITGNNDREFFSIAFNRSVARSLDIQLRQAEYYQQRLQAGEVLAP